MTTLLVDPSTLIAEKRKQIDELDAKIAELICKRHALVLEVGDIKKHNNIAIHDPGREAQQMSTFSAIASRNKVPPRIIIFPFKMIMLMSRHSQGENGTGKIIPHVCRSCHWKTAGLDDPGGSSFRVCPACQMPLL